MLYYYCKVELFGQIVILMLSGRQETMRPFLDTSIHVIETFVSYDATLNGVYIEW